jgi:hypothetical protein
LHEAGHAIALLASGYAVSKISTDGDTGQCVPAGQVCPRVLAIAAAAGALAEALVGGAVGHASKPDEHHFARSAGDAESANQAKRILAKYRDAVLCLARELDKCGSIGPAEFRELCRRPGSPLSQFAGHYPAASRRQLSAPGPRRVQCSVGIL